MNLDNLVYEKVYIIKYQSPIGHGLIVVRPSYYEKKINKFRKAFKDCNIYYWNECVLTPEVIAQLEKEKQNEA